jgi:cytochrome c oxidase subunit 2
MVATPTRVGTYAVVCAELCGIGHGQMRSLVRVVPAADFQSWIEEQRRVAAQQKQAAGGSAGAAAFQKGGCASCHTFAPANATGKVGPPLDNLAADARKYGRGASPEDYVRDSIVDPNKVLVAGFSAGVMPDNFGDTLSDQEIDALVKFLLKENA